MKASTKYMYNRTSGARLLFSGFILLIFLCSHSSFATALKPVAAADTSVTANIKQMLTNNSVGVTISFPASAKRFYQQRGFAPNWVNPQVNTKQTWDAMLLLDCVLQFGLAHEDYHPQDLLYARLHDILEHPSAISNAEKARYDILLTDAIITLINHLHFGKLNPEYPLSRVDGYKGSGFNAEVTLANALRQNDCMGAILAVQPKSKEYKDLQSHMHLLQGVYQSDCYETPEAEIRKMAINMERLRWSDIEGDTYIHINIPSFTLKFHQTDTTYLFKILAGKPQTPTPTLQSAVSYFTIAYNRKRQLADRPKLLTDRVNTYQGNNAVNTYTVATNEPGTIFFWLANNQGIAIQSVPGKLAKGQDRAITDGTVKVENGKKLAELLLAQDNAANKVKDMQAALKTMQLTNFVLHKPAQAKITYITCEMEDGILVTYPDVYNKDKKLEMQLYNTAPTLTIR